MWCLWIDEFYKEVKDECFNVCVLVFVSLVIFFRDSKEYIVEVLLYGKDLIFLLFFFSDRFVIFCLISLMLYFIVNL